MYNNQMKGFEDMGQEEQKKNKTTDFQSEKDRLKGIVGEIGGKNNAQHKIVSLIFAILIIVLLVLGVALQKISLFLTLEIVVLLGIFKVLWMFYEVQRSIHFQFWLLNSLEFRINDVDKRMKKIEKLLREKEITINSDESGESEDKKRNTTKNYNR